MKITYLLLPIFLILASCSIDDDYATINGRVQRALNGNGIADQSVIVMTRKLTGSGLFSTYKELDLTEVVTDVNGNFSVALLNDVDAFVTIVHQGDEVIVIKPAYDCYEPAIEVNGGIPIYYQLNAEDYKVDWNDFKALITPRTRMVIINTPHNPSGRIFSKEDMLQLQEILSFYCRPGLWFSVQL